MAVYFWFVDLRARNTIFRKISAVVLHPTLGCRLLTSLLFFGSVLFHELSHSVIARHYKIRVVSITLFIFGGVARIGRDPSKAIQEFNIAIAGPIASFVLSAAFYGISLLAPSDEKLTALATYLAATEYDSRPV